VLQAEPRPDMHFPMSNAEPSLPFPPLPNPLTAVVNAGGKRVVSTGSLVLQRNDSIEIKVEDLIFVLEFVEGDEQEVRYEVRDDKLFATFTAFDNSLGSSVSPVKVATIDGVPLLLGVYSQTIGDKGRLVIYTLLTEVVGG